MADIIYKIKDGLNVFYEYENICISTKIKCLCCFITKIELIYILHDDHFLHVKISCSGKRKCFHLVGEDPRTTEENLLLQEEDFPEDEDPALPPWKKILFSF